MNSRLLVNLLLLVLWALFTYPRKSLSVRIPADDNHWGEARVRRSNWLGLSRERRVPLEAEDRAVVAREKLAGLFGGKFFENPTIDLVRRNDDRDFRVIRTSKFFVLRKRFATPVDQWVEQINACLRSGAPGSIELVYRNFLTAVVFYTLLGALVFQVVTYEAP